MSKVWHGIKVVMANQFFVILPSIAVAYPIFKWRGFEFGLPLPSFNWLLLEVFLYAVFLEFVFYYSHRLLHMPAYYRFHKQHHEWTAPIACMALYQHPVETLFSITFSMFLGPFLVGNLIASFMLMLTD